MCGIGMVYAYAPAAPPVDRDELLRMREAMAHRGPDGAGLWCTADERVGMVHRRLAIIDLSDEAAQPMLDASRRFTIIFNGEIYNHRELRAELEREGMRFQTHSDTEVLLHMYERRGPAMLNALRGMFAFAIWDAREKRVFAARDPYGIKPFYYSTARGVFRAASQVRALAEGGGVSKETDPAGLAGFLLRGTVPEPYTTLRDVQALPSGTWMTVDERGASEPKRYFSIAAAWRDAADSPIPPVEAREIVRNAVVDSIRAHLVADVPVGAFLSAGKDSTTIAAIAHELGIPVRAVTLGFDEYRGQPNDEVPAAAALARHLELEHSVVMLNRDEFKRELPRALAAMDQPTIDGLNSYFVSRAAAEVGMKVALSGTGGDELFGGYTTFRKIPRSVRAAAPFRNMKRFGRGMRNAYRALVPNKGRMSPKSAGLFEYAGTYGGAYLMHRGLFMPWELKAVIGPELAREGLKRLDIVNRLDAALEPDPGTPFSRVAVLETTFFLRDQLLRDIDWASMAHSLEVRVPLIDVRLLQAVAPVLVNGEAGGKDLLVAAPQTPLPESVVSRPKTGFTLPLRRWLLDEMPKMFGMRAWALELYSRVAPLDRKILETGATAPLGVPGEDPVR
jgi:asparagine synthase (glutamine-hydrolysing)